MNANDDDHPITDRTLAPLDQLFLLRPENRDFIAGTSRRIVIGSGTNIFAVALFALLVIGFAAVTIINVSELLLFSRLGSGVPATATVIKHDRKQAGRSMHYWVIFRYLVPDRPQPYEVEQTVSDSTWTWLFEGGEVPILYLPDNPSVARLGGEYRNIEMRNTILPTAAILSLHSLLIIGIAVYILSNWHRARRRRSRLVTLGWLIPGTVVSCKTKVQFGVSNVWWVLWGFFVEVKYSYHTPKGVEKTHKARYQRQDLARHPDLLPQPGTPVAVLYYNERWYELM